MKNKICIFLFILCCTHQLRSQSLGLGTEGLIGFPDTVHLGEEIDFGLWVVNKSGFTFSGYLKIYSSVDGVFDPVALIYLPFVTITAGDSIPLFVSSMSISSPKFNLGTDVVVVWPSSAATTADSATNFLEVLDTLQTAIENFEIKDYVLFMQDKSSIVILQPSLIEKIVIYSMEGKKEKEETIFSNQLDCANLKPGIYIVQLVLKNKKVLVEKMMIQHE